MNRYYDPTSDPILYPPESPMPESRIENTTAAPGSVDPLRPEASPTGAAVLPPKFVPYALALLGVLGAIGALPTMGITLLPLAVTQGALVGALILGPLLGVASPGLRKK